MLAFQNPSNGILEICFGDTPKLCAYFVEVPSSAIHSSDMAAEYKIAAVLRSGNNLTLEITEQASASFLQTLLGVLSNAQ